MGKKAYLLGRFEQAVSGLPLRLRQAKLRLPAEDRSEAEELRLRAGCGLLYENTQRRTIKKLYSL